MRAQLAARFVIVLGAAAVVVGPASCGSGHPTFGTGSGAGGGSTGGATASGASASGATGSTGGGAASGSTGSGTGASSSSSTSASSGGTNSSSAVSSSSTSGAVCSGSCVPPAPPAGWTGPVAVYDAPGAAPSCPSGYTKAYDGFAGLVFQPAQCGCACNPPTGEQCDPVDVHVFSGGNACSSTPCGSVMLSAGMSCAGVPCAGSVPPFEISAQSPATTGGSCAVKSSTSLPTPTWADSVRACDPASPPTPAGCTGGDLCVPPASNFHACIMSQSQSAVPCPSGSPYSVQKIAYGGEVDTRSCTLCMCGTPAGTCKVPLAAIVGGCNGGVTTMAGSTPLACTQLGTATAVSIAGPPVIDAACPASGGQPVGSVTPSMPTTFCCTP